MTDPKCHIHFHSGTGNSRRVAIWLSEFASEHDISNALYRVEKRNHQPIPPIHKDDRLILTMPTHSFTTPWVITKHILRLPSGKGAFAYVLPTRAGFRIGRNFGFGVEGTAWLIASLLLLLKGYRPKGAIGIDMPSNWIQAHPGFPRKTSLAIVERARTKTREFAQETLIENKTHWLTPMNLFQVLIGLPLLLIAIPYTIMGRFMMGKILYANSKCTHCGACADACPCQAIRMIGKDQHPWWTYRCTNCMRCLSICPTNAVQTSHGWLILLIALMVLPLNHLAAEALNQQWMHHWTINWIFAYGVTFFTYPLLFLASRSKKFCRLLDVLSLTTHWRRYIEPETKRDELTNLSQDKPEA